MFQIKIVVVVVSVADPDPDLFAGSGFSPPNLDPDPALVVFYIKKISISVQYRAYVYLFTL
jgi:hypothetical protein